MPRKKICKIVTGSHLYGLETELSDRDYAGVYLPSADDILGLEPYPPELNENVKASAGARNTAEDVDSKVFSLRQFMLFAAHGQSAQLEMLFAQPIHHAIHPSFEWEEIIANRDAFLSRNAFVPFVRFALAQATKATMKGENLIALRKLIAWIAGLEPSLLQRPIRTFFESKDGENHLGPIQIAITRNAFGAELLTLAHRNYDSGASLKRLLDSLRQLEGKYGVRSKAAAESGIDFKSLSHAYRMIFEAEELLTTGALSLPLRDDARYLVRSIKEKRIPPGLNWEKDIIARINHLEFELAPRSGLPQEPDWGRITGLHQKLLRGQL